MKFCNKCGAPQADAVAAPGATPATPATVMAPAPPPSTGGGGALKIILIVVAVIVGIGILGMVTCTVVVRRALKNSHLSQSGDSVKADTPFGSFSTSKDPEQIAKDIGVDLYPGAEMQKNASASVTMGSIHTVTAVLLTSDSVDKVCTFYKEKFANASVTSSDQNRCNLVSNDQKNMITINIDADGDSTKLQITNVSKK
jgi:hypothetical protein